MIRKSPDVLEPLIDELGAYGRTQNATQKVGLSVHTLNSARATAGKIVMWKAVGLDTEKIYAFADKIDGTSRSIWVWRHYHENLYNY